MKNPLPNNFIIAPIDIGNQAIVTGGWVNYPDICLVSIVYKGGNLTSRLDLIKHKFMDHIPGTRSKEAIAKLVEVIRQEQKLRL